MWRCVLALGAVSLVSGAGTGASAVEDLLDRVLPGARDHFCFRLITQCPGSVEPPCYHLSDADGKVAIAATGISELTAGLGFYLRSYCNLTIGWPRGGGSNLFLPNPWPRVGSSVVKKRNVPWSYMMNVCTHSYSLVWYDWPRWEQFIDWMALSGINNVLAMTGQEEVQYKVFKSFGLNDSTIRGWFNGPALLTWSRGQNEYGAGIAGPLPRSWMKQQWELQRLILKRYRELGIIGQLPGFQANVPVELKYLKKDANITAQGATGWLDALDPLYGQVADVWMKTLINDFGTDHWYQLDGYFNGGTAPWLSRAPSASSGNALRSGTDVPVDPMWHARGTAAYTGLNRTDPDAIWSFQGFAFEFWNDSAEHASWLNGFVSAVPAGRLNIVDMDYGYGEWRKWNDSAFFGANFIWSALHNFGGTDGIKGNLSKVNDMPFAALEAGKRIWGTGFTAEGIDQNPAYYDFLIDQPWRTERVPDIPAALSLRAHRRYGLASIVQEVDSAWKLLAGSMYAQDVGVQDSTGVAHIPAGAAGDFLPDKHTPAPAFCTTFQAWSQLVAAGPRIRSVQEPFRYDLVNLGRDVLARLSTLMSWHFHDAIFPSGGGPPMFANVSSSGRMYMEILEDLDTLVGTDEAFLLGSWISWAREFGKGAGDCVAKGFPAITSCEDFYEWNARVQVTTWNPTPRDAARVPGGPVDYAAKHWNGLIRGYYAERVSRLMVEATKAALAEKPLQKADADKIQARLAYEWTTAFDMKYPEKPVGDALTVSQHLLRKYASFFDACTGDAIAVFV